MSKLSSVPAYFSALFIKIIRLHIRDICLSSEYANAAGRENTSLPVSGAYLLKSFICRAHLSASATHLSSDVSRCASATALIFPPLLGSAFRRSMPVLYALVSRKLPFSYNHFSHSSRAYPSFTLRFTRRKARLIRAIVSR